MCIVKRDDFPVITKSHDMDEEEEEEEDEPEQEPELQPHPQPPHQERTPFTHIDIQESSRPSTSTHLPSAMPTLHFGVTGTDPTASDAITAQILLQRRGLALLRSAGFPRLPLAHTVVPAPAASANDPILTDTKPEHHPFPASSSHPSTSTHFPSTALYFFTDAFPFYAFAAVILYQHSYLDALLLAKGLPPLPPPYTLVPTSTAVVGPSISTQFSSATPTIHFGVTYMDPVAFYTIAAEFLHLYKGMDALLTAAGLPPLPPPSYTLVPAPAAATDDPMHTAPEQE